MMKTQENKVLESTLPDTTNWNSIKWNKTFKYVDKLQKRIYHAESRGNSRKVRNLQRMLIPSGTALFLAIRKVTQLNKGKRCHYIDSFRVLSDKRRAELFNAIKTINIKLHNPKPPYRKYIQKKKWQIRFFSHSCDR